MLFIEKKRNFQNYVIRVESDKKIIKKSDKVGITVLRYFCTIFILFFTPFYVWDTISLLFFYDFFRFFNDFFRFFYDFWRFFWRFFGLLTITIFLPFLRFFTIYLRLYTIFRNILPFLTHMLFTEKMKLSKCLDYVMMNLTKKIIKN